MRIYYYEDIVFSAISFTRTLLKLRRALLKMLKEQDIPLFIVYHIWTHTKPQKQQTQCLNVEA